MPSYIYHYVNTKGQTRIGYRQDDSEQACRDRLAKEAIYPITMLSLRSIGEKKIDQRRFAVFLRQVAMALKTGVPLLQTLHDIAGEQSHTNMQAFIKRLEKRVMAGKTLSDAFREEKWIEPMIVQWLRIGEKQGRLAEVLSDIYAYLNKREETRKRIQQDLFYPLMVLIAVIVVSALMFLVVMPLLARQFMNLGTEIPWMMRVPLFVHDFLASYGMFLLLALVSVIVLSVGYSQHTKNKGWWRKQCYRLAMEISVLKRLFVLIVYVPFSRLLGELLQSGVPASAAIEDVALYFSNRSGNEDIAKMAEILRQGHSMSAAISHAPFVPELARQMIYSGERQGRLPEAMIESSDYYETVLLEEMRMWMRFIEPVAIILLGLLVLGMALGLFLPILDSYQLMAG